ncbi:MAG TPA: hypothetical protein PKY77_01590 [Phycisphaerae bacterium]|nr:hypothetical protein [Phycisphaerae bacterium]HRY68022.1 hypothetical protein [Phycisphaerae bacterium]HSA26759.1 hypothetical protein [Phycisphaerae bacterium]
MKRTVTLWIVSITLAVAWTAWSSPGLAEPPASAKAFDFEEASRDVPKPRELYPLVKQDMVAMDLEILSDEIVPSDSDPSKRLRKITGRFNSIELEDKEWIHPFTLFTPADNTVNETPERKGRVVIVTSPGWVSYPGHVEMYGEPIVTRTGHPTMVVLSPGVYADGRDIEADIAVLSRMRQKTGKNYYNMNCQLALVYIQAMNVLEKVLKLDTVKAVIGGHSKRGRSATVAAAMDGRVAGVVIMGNEGVYRTDRLEPHLSFHHAFFQEQVDVPVLYIGATNEGGYKMFNVNIMQERLKRPMTVELIPNYHHYNFEEKQYIDFMMWVSHVFDGRPITRITEYQHERRDRVNIYRARIESQAKIRLVRVWYVYATNVTWSDLMWYDWLMENRGEYYEARVPGAMPDAFLIEVADTAQGIPGYVTSLPRKLTNVPVVERDPSKAGWMGPPERREGKGE